MLHYQNERLASRVARAEGPEPPWPKSELPKGLFTPGQLDILALVLQGMSRAEIAAELGISAGTVEAQTKLARALVGLPHTWMCAVVAAEEGLLAL
jgi:DNA-binding NarL/FixJ family response regulator